MTPQTETGTCDCGATVTREIPDGWLGQLTAKTPFVCDGCITRQEAEDHEQDRAFAADAAIRRQLRRLRESGLPARYADVRLEQMDLNSPAVAAARVWVDSQPSGDDPLTETDSLMSAYQRNDPPVAWDSDDPRRGLLLTGPIGVGKTHLAAAALGSLVDRGRNARWLTAPLMFARLGSGLGTPEHEKILGILTGRVVLVLDDLDKTRPTEYGAENVFLAIDQRVTSGTPLLVTTNLRLSELAARWPEPFGEAIASRLAGYCRVVKMEGHDRRLGEAA